ncbi:hypothetical protein [Halorussus halophilus]|uniref:hypothetical protein n=1 Tax=Halorussus halophilus TaxID=2650975 RepID=UPI0013013B96|nr:hypothetical protein [Halorussus halophilus]
MKRPNFDHAARIARVEVIRGVRAIRGSGTRTVAMGFALLFWTVIPTLVGGFAAYSLGQALPDAPFEVLSAIRGGAAVWWVGVAVLVTARTAGKRGELDHPEGILTTVPARDAALGLLLAEYGRIVLVASVPVIAITVALVAGSGVFLSLLVVPATAILVFALATAVGFLGGVAVKWVTIRTPWLAKHRTALFAVAFFAYMFAIVSNTFGDVVALLSGALRGTPLAWFGDAVLLGLPGIEANPTYAVAAVAMTVVLLVVVGSLSVRATVTLWYTDRAQTTVDDDAVREETETTERNHRERDSYSGETRSSGETSAVARALSSVVSRPTLTVTRGAWRRAKRSPIKLLYVAYPLFFLYGPLRTAFETGVVPKSLPPLVALYGAWAAGATVLNPLGDEGAVLPTTLLSGVSGREFVAGHVLSAALVGVPVVATMTTVVGVVSSLALGQSLLLGVLSALFVVAGTVLAIGVGTLFPRFSTVEVFQSREVVMPSKGAFVAYSLVLFGGAAGAVVALVPAYASVGATMIGALASALASSTSANAISAGAAQVVGGVVAVLVGLVGPTVAYRYASRQFETYVVE